MELESKMAGLDPSVLDSDQRPGELSHFTCPECSGPLYEIQTGNLLRFRCRVGHAYTAESVLDEKTEELEQALYAALNNLEENALMVDRTRPRPRGGALRGAGARRETAGRGDPPRPRGRDIGRPSGRPLTSTNHRKPSECACAPVAMHLGAQGNYTYRAVFVSGRENGDPNIL
jgi:hypothetical protein